VLAGQRVSFRLKASAIVTGQTTVASGAGQPAGKGRTVELQIRRSGRWYDVATAHERGNGSFSFTIKGTTAGHFEYRAVVSDLPGYLQYGYSASRTLNVTH
jgi:hypothetical protein